MEDWGPIDNQRDEFGFLFHLSLRRDGLLGPVVKIISVIIMVTGLTLAFGDTSGGFRRLIQIVFGLSIAFAASSFFFSFSGGARV